MEKRLVIQKGYTITVDSWENDLDNSQTNSITVKTLEQATALYNLMQLCVSKNNLSPGVVRLGNTLDSFSSAQIELITDFIKENPILGELEVFEDEEEEYDNVINMFGQITSDLLGSSEYFTCRVMAKCEVTYSDKDIYLDIIEIK